MVGLAILGGGLLFFVALYLMIAWIDGYRPFRRRGEGH